MKEDTRLTPDSQYWRTVHGNEVDILVLEWCKLFAERRGKYGWRKVVPNSETFEQGLLIHLESSRAQFKTYVDSMKYHRDKFVAHLDDENAMYIPQFDLAWKATQFYFLQVTEELKKIAIVAEDDLSLQDYYATHFSEARVIYDRL